MKNFYQLSEMVRQKAIEPPIQYKIRSYDVSSSPINSIEGNTELRPLTDEDLKSTSAEDAVDFYVKKYKGKSKFGAPMTDKEYMDFMGIPN